MTIYYTLTFGLLAAEMATFCVVLAPLPFTVRRKMFHFMSDSPVVGKIAYALKISFIFVAVLFLDALQRMLKVAAEGEMAKSKEGMHDARTESTFAARKFYTQRNMYLTGFTLFLSLVLTRTFYIMLDLIHTQEEYAKLKKAGANGAANGGLSSQKIKDLEAKAAESDRLKRDLENLKAQAKSQGVEYDRLATEYNNATGAVNKNKKTI